MGLNNLGNLDDLRGSDLNGPNYSSQESGGAPEQQNDDAAPLQGEASLSQQTGPAAPDATSGSGLLFQNSFSLDGTFASLTSIEQAAYKVDCQQAENNLSGEFTNSLTANVDFETVNVPPNPDGSGFGGLNQASAYRAVSLSSYFSAL
jgi:hypothetical protein